eukprot:TRINITY_DN7347_c0_g1_i1.p1 TRINITY_DN7347_c0_g1~~TRINITY_DN7347_c0_g1_i1.p1  ORF type:complete len:613 (-),score=131.47 TRINITY_DN7347_c0_g1_i1:1110-2948(-)
MNQTHNSFEADDYSKYYDSLKHRHPQHPTSPLQLHHQISPSYSLYPPPQIIKYEGISESSASSGSGIGLGQPSNIFSSHNTLPSLYPQKNSTSLPSPMSYPPSMYQSTNNFPPQSTIKSSILDFKDPSSPSSSMQSTQPTQLIVEVYQNYQRQKEELEKLRILQKKFLQNPRSEDHDLLGAHHKSLKNKLESQLKSLSYLQHHTILTPSDIHRLFLLTQDLKIQQLQLNLYWQELLQLSQPSSASNQSLFALVVVEDPFPIVISKGKQLDDDPVVVQLLSASNVEIQSYSKVHVAMIFENQPMKTPSQKSIETDTQSLDSHRRIVKWHLRFLHGTRKIPVTLRFGLQMQVNHVTFPVESQQSQPFIIITNECQWEESEGSLLKKSAFGDQLEVSWCFFANLLQRHFLRSTRQDPIRPIRPLSCTDLNYIHKKMFQQSQTITQKDFDTFWAWFGKIVQKLRYQRHICPLWYSGIIQGFLSREEIYQALIHEEPGTFLVRFSERHAGLFAIAYRIDDLDPKSRVRHFLMRQDAKKTLPDFLGEQPSFIYLLQLQQNNSARDDSSPTQSENSQSNYGYRKVFKDSLLETYYSKKTCLPPTNGYDDNIHFIKSHAE